MKFKVGDRVVVVSGWYFEESGKHAVGTLEDDNWVFLDEPTTCRWEYRKLAVSQKELEHEEVYNSPLYQALK